MDDDVTLRESPGKGTGVFTLKPLQPGQLVVRYTGELRRRDDHIRALGSGSTTGDYAFRLGAGWVVDGEAPSKSSWGRFINHSKRKSNCEPVPAGVRALAGSFQKDATDGFASWQNQLIESLADAAVDSSEWAPIPISPFAIFIETTREIVAGEELLFDCTLRLAPEHAEHSPTRLDWLSELVDSRYGSARRW
jgi:SET domain-containing protein